MSAADAEAGAGRTKPSCKACRLSKVKCIYSNGDEVGACDRCARLGLACMQVPPGKRGRPAGLVGPALQKMRQPPDGSPPPAARGHAVRATPIPLAAPGPTTSLASPAEPLLPPSTGPDILEQLSERLMKTMISGSRAETQEHKARVQRTLVSQLVLVAQRDGNCERLGRALIFAGRIGLTPAEVLRPLSAPGASMDDLLGHMPDFIAEWFHGERPCVFRAFADGYVRVRANGAMRRALGMAGTAAATPSITAAVQPGRAATGLAAGSAAGSAALPGRLGTSAAIDVGVVEAGLLHAVLMVPNAGEVLTSVLASMLEQIMSGGAPPAPDVHRHAHGHASQPLLIVGVGECRLSGRMVVLGDSQAMWSALRFVPVGAAEDGAAERGAEARAQPQPAPTPPHPAQPAPAAPAPQPPTSSADSDEPQGTVQELASLVGDAADLGLTLEDVHQILFSTGADAPPVAGVGGETAPGGRQGALTAHSFASDAALLVGLSEEEVERLLRGHGGTAGE